MNRKTLEHAKIQKEEMVAKLMSEIKKLDEQIKAAKDLPISAEEFMIKQFDISYQQSKEYDCTFDWKDVMNTFQSGEKNHRKRMQPLIDFAYEIKGVLNDYWQPKLEKILKTLEDNEQAED